MQANLKVMAHAKLNLYLEILGKRPDSYHELDSHAVFLQLADELEFTESDRLILHDESAIEDNLILQTAKMLQEHFAVRNGAQIRLTKRIPIAAGLGGGSADAAATIIGLCQLWNLQPQEAEILSLAKQIGADVPACLYAHLHNINSLRFQGIGEKISALNLESDLHFLLVNPAKKLSTASVFAEIQTYSPVNDDTNYFARRNDMQAAAIRLVPEIAELLQELENLPNAQLARMSGSGATCFAVFASADEAAIAAEIIKSRFANYWVECTFLKSC